MKISKGNKGVLNGHKSSHNDGHKRTLSRGELPKLTAAEEEVLRMLSEEFLTAKQISQRRQTEPSRTYKIIRKLKKFGLWNGVDTNGHFLGEWSKPVSNRFQQNSVEDKSFSFPVENQIRLHGEVWRFELLQSSLKYQESIGQSFLFDNNSIVCFSDVLMIHSGTSFFGEDTAAATRKSCQYWTNFAVKLENLLGIKLLKPRSQNFRRTRSHYAHINNELAEQCLKESQKIQIRASEDGRVWFVIDNSFNLKEAETQHPKTAEPDMQGIAEPFFNDLRDFYQANGFIPKTTETWALLGQNAALIQRMGDEAIKPLTEQIKLHLAVMRKIDGGIGELREGVAGLSSAVLDIKRSIQKPLDALKARVKCLDDVFAERAAVEALTDEEKWAFTDWMMQKFGGGA